MEILYTSSGVHYFIPSWIIAFLVAYNATVFIVEFVIAFNKK